MPSLSARLQRLFTKASMGGSSRARWSHEIFPSARNVKFNEMEYAVPAANGADCIREIAEVIRSRKIAGVFPLEFRFVKADDIWLSPFYKRDAVTISVHQYHRQSYDELFGAAEAIFRRYGGRPHWGKLHTLKAADFEKLYPRFGDFCGLAHATRPQGQIPQYSSFRNFRSGEWLRCASEGGACFGFSAFPLRCRPRHLPMSPTITSRRRAWAR